MKMTLGHEPLRYKVKTLMTTSTSKMSCREDPLRSPMPETSNACIYNRVSIPLAFPRIPQAHSSPRTRRTSAEYAHMAWCSSKTAPRTVLAALPEHLASPTPVWLDRRPVRLPNIHPGGGRDDAVIPWELDFLVLLHHSQYPSGAGVAAVDRCC